MNIASRSSASRTLVNVGPGVRVRSRHGYDRTAAFPELAALASLASRSKVVFDGELVCLDAATGRPSFERLMARTQARLPTLAARRDPATFMAFDVLAVDGEDLCALPWACQLGRVMVGATYGSAWMVTLALA